MNMNSAAIQQPLCAAFDPKPRKPRIAIPRLACDTHAHVCGPAARYPYYSKRTYTPPDSLLPAYEHMLTMLGFEHAVLVQPSVYGTDNTAMLDAMKAAGPKFRGVAALADDISDEEIRRMHNAGVRGARLNIVDVKDRKPGTLPLAQLEKLARRIKPFGWHIEFLMHVDEFPDLDQMLGDFPVDTVYGHLGYVKTNQGIDNPGFQALLRLMKAGKAWVKLTGPYRISQQLLPHADTESFARSLIAAASRQVVWGSDWPHVHIKTPMPNDADICDLLAAWVPSEKQRKQVLVDNPARLYEFG
jgi:predicted TIM-barrel fold metal-dependent hydrolase